MTPVFEQEVRFALVMYGGVSLAIYINGVTQEFLNLVRSTAVDATNQFLFPDVTGTAAVYRKLASILRPENEGDADAVVRTRFAVDIVSGTSAGGINGIFLGKAIARGQSLDQLSSLWITEADLSDLLNDKKCASRPHFAQDEPESLLSGPRMYAKLVRAFEGMDKGPEQNGPLQPEIDVFITTTDIQGLELPIELSDMLVFEKRHKNVFPLSHGGGQSDFERPNNSFLAFAARCTSSFPFAFEPMQLQDIDDVLAEVDPDRKLRRAASDGFQQFFPAYSGDVRKRAFGDGGYLNNKPFTHAIRTLANRRSELHVKRVLAYVEPSPDNRSGNPDAPPPNFLENSLAAAVTLHQYETIREDLQRLLERNRLIERVREVIANVDTDVEQWRAGRPGRVEGEEYAKRDVQAEIGARGPSYAGYHRLKVRSVTDNLACLVTNALELQQDSDEFRGIRLLVSEWRKRRYAEGAKKGFATESRFLLDFDLGYRLRRLRFVRTKLDELFVLSCKGTVPAALQVEAADPALPGEIQSLKRELIAITAELEGLERRSCGRGKANLAGDKAAALKVDREWLRQLLTLSPDEQAKAIAWYLDQNDAVTALAGKVAEEFATCLKTAAKEANECFHRRESPLKAAIRAWASNYFENYEDYDQVTFPIFYETEVGEAEPVSVIRISPQDAKSIIDESNDRRRKLAGIVLFHFGAFFERLWRTNDILWGRLDGAERIICSLLPRNSPRAAALIREAHLSIIDEQLRPDQANELKSLLVQTILALPRERRDAANLRQILEREIGRPVDAKVDAVFTACLNSDEILKHLKASYEVNREFNPANTLDVAGRATAIVGGMLEKVAKANGHGESGTSPFEWVARIGSVFWGLVQLAIPGGFGNRVLRHWLKILYALELLLLAASILLVSKDSQQFAITALAITGGVHLLTTFLSDLMRGKRRLIRVPVFLAATAIVALAGVGVWTVKTMTIPWLDQKINGPAQAGDRK